MQKIRRDDNVLLLKGRDRGKSGQVRKVIPGESKVIVTGVNIVKRHMKPRGPQRPGGIVEREAPVPWANVALICAACDKPARIGFKVLGDGRKVRFCKRCDANID